MITKKRLIQLVLCIIVVGGVFSGWAIFDYLKFRKVAAATSTMPWQDGGTITKVTQCILDSPTGCPNVFVGSCTLCTTSCPNSAVLGTDCIMYNEIDVSSQLGTTYILAGLYFSYSGGGTTPKAGDQFLAGGASNILPWVIGIPGASASRIQQLADTFKFIIAGIRGNF